MVMKLSRGEQFALEEANIQHTSNIPSVQTISTFVMQEYSSFEMVLKTRFHETEKSSIMAISMVPRVHREDTKIVL